MSSNPYIRPANVEQLFEALLWMWNEEQRTGEPVPIENSSVMTVSAMFSVVDRLLNAEAAIRTLRSQVAS